MSEKICYKLKRIHANTTDLLKKEIEPKNENSIIILIFLGRNELVDDKFVLKLLEERLYAYDCMINGWIVTDLTSHLEQNKEYWR